MARFTVNFISHCLMRTVDMTVIIPSVTIPESLDAARCAFPSEELRYVGRAPYPVLYLLHGYGNNHTAWTAYSNAELYAEEHNMAVVMISAENKCYINGIGDDRFADFISSELPDFVQGMFPVSRQPEDTYIAGLSMGGYGALYHALSAPEKFRAVGAFSAAVNLKPGDEIPGTPVTIKTDLEQLLEKNSGAVLPKVYLACGENDFLFTANQQFYQSLVSAKADVTWSQSPGFGHEWRFWDQEIEKFLNWIPRTDAYAQKGTRKI